MAPYYMVDTLMILSVVRDGKTPTRGNYFLLVPLKLSKTIYKSQPHSSYGPLKQL